MKNISLSEFHICLFLSLKFFLRSCDNRLTQQPDQITKCNGIDRLKKRIGNYRQHHTICGPRFDQSFNGSCEQQSIETVVLQKRFLENKAKKAAKKADKKQLENAQVNNLQNTVQVVSGQIQIDFFLLRIWDAYLLLRSIVLFALVY